MNWDAHKSCLGEVALLSPISAIPRTCVPCVWWHSQTHLKWPFWKQSEAYHCPVPWEQQEWNGPCDQNRVALLGRLVQSPPTALRSWVGLGPLLWHNQIHGNPNRNIKSEWENLQIGKKDSALHKIIHHGTALHHRRDSDSVPTPPCKTVLGGQRITEDPLLEMGFIRKQRGL